jgi:hypothetical protein
MALAELLWRRQGHKAMLPVKGLLLSLKVTNYCAYFLLAVSLNFGEDENRIIAAQPNETPQQTGHAIDESNGPSSGGISSTSSARASFPTRIRQGMES